MYKVVVFTKLFLGQYKKNVHTPLVYNSQSHLAILTDQSYCCPGWFVLATMHPSLSWLQLKSPVRAHNYHHEQTSDWEAILLYHLHQKQRTFCGTMDQPTKCILWFLNNTILINLKHVKYLVKSKFQPPINKNEASVGLFVKKSFPWWQMKEKYFSHISFPTNYDNLFFFTYCSIIFTKIVD